MEPGSFVVCINAKPMSDCTNKYLHLISEGQIYTIRKVLRPQMPDPGIVLEEVDLPRDPFIGEIGYHYRRFRPCKKTSIEVFQKMLFKEPCLQDA